MDCALCKIVGDAASDEVVFRNEFASVIVSDDWAVLGHLVVISAAHVENSADLTPPAFYGFFDVFRAAERALLSTLAVDRVMVMKLGIAVPHLHHHLYPFRRETTREEVFAAIDMRERHELTGRERSEFLRKLREAIEAEAR